MTPPQSPITPSAPPPRSPSPPTPPLQPSPGRASPTRQAARRFPSAFPPGPYLPGGGGSRGSGEGGRAGMGGGGGLGAASRSRGAPALPGGSERGTRTLTPAGHRPPRRGYHVNAREGQCRVTWAGGGATWGKGGAAARLRSPRPALQRRTTRTPSAPRSAGRTTTGGGSPPPRRLDQESDGRPRRQPPPCSAPGGWRQPGPARSGKHWVDWAHWGVRVRWVDEPGRPQRTGELGPQTRQGHLLEFAPGGPGPACSPHTRGGWHRLQVPIPTPPQLYWGEKSQ